MNSQRQTLNHAQLCDWLRLSRSQGVGPVTFSRLLARFGDAATALSELPKLARRGGKSGRTGIPSREDAQSELDATAQIGAEILPSCDPDYPDLLRHLDPPPPVISVLGNKYLLQKRCVAIVGSRNASAIGMRFAGQMATDLGQRDVIVTSGLARGIDGAAHAGSLETGTIAVVAGGVDHVYPPQHSELRSSIIREGAIISERSLGRRVTARDFPRRNRIISGLSVGTIVIEAAKRSGSLITARYALEQNREVFAAPGSPLDPRASGANGLIRQGAHLIESAKDVMDVLDDLLQPSLLEPFHDTYTIANEPVNDKQIDQARENIKNLLSPSAISMDDLIRSSGYPAHVCAAVLVELELAGFAECYPGGMIAAGEEWSV